MIKFAVCSDLSGFLSLLLLDGFFEAALLHWTLRYRPIESALYHSRKNYGTSSQAQKLNEFTNSKRR